MNARTARTALVRVLVATAVGLTWLDTGVAAAPTLRPDIALDGALLPAPVGEAFYNAPEPLPGNPGDVVWATLSPAPVTDVYGVDTTWTALPVFNRPSGPVTPEVYRVLYHSTDRKGRSVPAFALVVVDPNRGPDAPMIVAMHGWVGFGDHCGVMRSDDRGRLVAAPNLIHRYVSRGYVLVIPDGPGMGGRGVATPMIKGDAARNLIDAARSAQRLTKTDGRVLFHGHSLGGMMVMSVPDEAATYAPNLRIGGIMSLAGLGYNGPGTSAWLSVSQGQALPMLIYARMLMSAYDGEIDVLRHVTPRGRARLQQIENACSIHLGMIAGGDMFEKLFKPSFTPFLNRMATDIPTRSNVPLHVITPVSDNTVSSLPHQHAYLRRCKNGQPTFSTIVDAYHANVTSIAHENPAVREWVVNALEGSGVGTGCGDLRMTLNVGYAYTAQTLLLTYADTSSTGELLLAARGNCRVHQKQLALGFSGRCAFSITEKFKKRTGRIWHFEADIL